MAEQGVKRKLENDDCDIFSLILDNKEKRDQLHFAYTAIYYGFQELSLGILRVDETNARISEGFSSASVHTSNHRDSGGLKTFPLGMIFRKGLYVLRSYLFEEKIPHNTQLRMALARLLYYMDSEIDDHDGVFTNAGTEGEWAVKLSQHLFSKLAVTDKYTIDSYPELVLEGMQHCPCEKKESILGRLGDTTFGCSKGWHGRTDILIDNIIPVAVTDDKCENAATALADDSSQVSSLSDSFSEKDSMEILSQTIVFSFLQHKENKDVLSLVPGIGIGVKKLIIFFYDCIKDILLGTQPVLYNYSDKLDVPAVVSVWLVLNYKLFSSGVTDEMKGFKADFFARVGQDFLQIYREEVTRPLHTEKNKSADDTKTTWARNPRWSEYDLDDCAIHFMSLPKKKKK